MEKVWFKLRQTDYPPPPEDAILRGDGDDSAAPLCLGHTVPNLKSLDFPLNQHSVLAFPHRMRVFCNTTLNFTWDDTRLKSPGTNLAAGAPILAAAGIAAKASLQFAFMRTVQSYEAYERLETYIVQPTKGYIEDCLAQDNLKAHIKGKVAWSMFLITGIKVARAGKREAQEQKSLAADIGPEMDLPLVATIRATATTHRIASQKTSGEHPGDFVWAIRVAKISRGFLMKDWTIAPYSTRATWSTAAEDEVDVEAVLRGEGLDSFKVVEDEELDEAVVFDEDMTD
ncbi:Ff.00g035700.m01.CDS01 [Fusarium sp. VM40]|nr:Ff.00g035700.m01.CDS01 [Fusarium sp. VM40]